MKRRVRFLTAEQVIALHDGVLERWGELAAAYAVHIVQGRVFADGNKRPGAAAMLTFLQANGRQVNVAAPRIASMLIELQARAEAGEDIGRLVRWTRMPWRQSPSPPGRGPRGGP